MKNKNNDESQINQKIEKCFVCASCAKIMKTKYRVTKLTKNQNFVCAVGKCMIHI